MDSLTRHEAVLKEMRHVFNQSTTRNIGKSLKEGQRTARSPGGAEKRGAFTPRALSGRGGPGGGRNLQAPGGLGGQGVQHRRGGEAPPGALPGLKGQRLAFILVPIPAAKTIAVILS
jgi:hypothetical protein